MIFVYSLIQSVILMLLWYLIARFFYPHYAKQTAIAVVSDPEYKKKSQEATEEWLSGLVRKEVAVIAETVSEHLDIPGMVWDSDLDKHFLHMLNGWYGSLHAAVEKQVSAEDGAIRDAVSYAQMNQGSPVALDAIQKALAAKSPILAAGMSLLMQNNNGSRSPPQQGRGGY